jgi:hypothetical protein
MIARAYRWLLPLHRVELLTLTDWWADMAANRQWVETHRAGLRFYADHWRDASAITLVVFDALRILRAR